MNRTVNRTVGYTAMLFALALSAGCATTGDVDEAKKMAQEAKQAADQANSTAMEAKNEAAAAKAAAEMTNEKIDRAFKKSVQK